MQFEKIAIGGIPDIVWGDPSDECQYATNGVLATCCGAPNSDTASIRRP